MKTHIEFHVALAFIDLASFPSVDQLITSGGLWGSLSSAEQTDYWTATGVLAALWKAEVRGCKTTDIPDVMVSTLVPQVLANLEEANPGKSKVFSLVILRW